MNTTQPTKRKRKHLTEKDFNLIKSLHEAGLSAGKIVNVTGYSYGPVGRVNKYKSFAEYKAPKPKPEPKLAAIGGIDYDVDGATPALPQDQTFVYSPTDVNDKLERIAVALENLVEAWNRPTDKKGLFNR